MQLYDCVTADGEKLSFSVLVVVCWCEREREGCVTRTTSILCGEGRKKRGKMWKRRKHEFCISNFYIRLEFFINFFWHFREKHFFPSDEYSRISYESKLVSVEKKKWINWATKFKCFSFWLFRCQPSCKKSFKILWLLICIKWNILTHTNVWEPFWA